MHHTCLEGIVKSLFSLMYTCIQNTELLNCYENKPAAFMLLEAC